MMVPCMYIANRILSIIDFQTTDTLCSDIFLNKGFHLLDILYLDNWAKK